MKIRLIAPAIALALLAAGCSSGDEAVAEPRATPVATAAPAPAPAPVPSVTPAPERSGQQGDDAEFVAWVSGRDGLGGVFSDDEVVTIARGTCAQIEAGKPYVMQLIELLEVDFTDEQREAASGIMGAGISNYCPERLDESLYDGK